MTGLFTDLFSFINVKNSYIIKWAAVGGVLFFFLHLYYLFRQFEDKWISLLFGLALSVTIPIVNTASYGVMFIYPWSFVAAVLSVRKFSEWLEHGGYGKLLESMCLVIFANYIYQAAATAAFLCFFIFVYYHSEKNGKKSVYLFLYAGGMLIYYITSKIITKMYGISMLSRAEFIGIRDIIGKLKWFFQTVLHENIKQAIASLFGCWYFNEDGLYSLISFSNAWMGKIFYFIAAALTAAFLYRIIKRDKILLGWIVILAPCAYYCFLVLKESSYLSYYSVALCGIIIFIIIEGIKDVCYFIHRDCRYVLSVLIFVNMISSMSYISDFWIGRNEYAYNYMKQELMNSVTGPDDTRPVHIYGSVYPGQADIYVMNEVKMILKELNLGEKTITVSSNRYYNEVFEKSLYRALYGRLEKSDQAFMDGMYICNDVFGIYTIDYEKITEENVRKLQNVMHKSGYIPDSTDGTIEINLENLRNIG